MAFKKQVYDIREFLLLVLIGLPLIASTNIDCSGRSFHCVNSTHFIICVDLGGGISQTVDDFVISCPPPTVCQGNNRFECEFPPLTTPLPMLPSSEATNEITTNPTTQQWEVVTTNVPKKTREADHSDLKYFNTVSLTTLPEVTTPVPSIKTTSVNNLDAQINGTVTSEYIIISETTILVEPTKTTVIENIPGVTTEVNKLTDILPTEIPTMKNSNPNTPSNATMAKFNITTNLPDVPVSSTILFNHENMALNKTLQMVSTQYSVEQTTSTTVRSPAVEATKPNVTNSEMENILVVTTETVDINTPISTGGITTNNPETTYLLDVTDSTLEAANSININSRTKNAFIATTETVTSNIPTSTEQIIISTTSPEASYILNVNNFTVESHKSTNINSETDNILIVTTETVTSNTTENVTSKYAISAERKNVNTVSPQTAYSLNVTDSTVEAVNSTNNNNRTENILIVTTEATSGYTPFYTERINMSALKSTVAAIPTDVTSKTDNILNGTTQNGTSSIPSSTERININTISIPTTNSVNMDNSTVEDAVLAVINSETDNISTVTTETVTSNISTEIMNMSTISTSYPKNVNDVAIEFTKPTDANSGTENILVVTTETITRHIPLSTERTDMSSKHPGMPDSFEVARPTDIDSKTDKNMIVTTETVTSNISSERINMTTINFETTNTYKENDFNVNGGIPTDLLPTKFINMNTVSHETTNSLHVSESVLEADKLTDTNSGTDDMLIITTDTVPDDIPLSTEPIVSSRTTYSLNVNQITVEASKQSDIISVTENILVGTTGTVTSDIPKYSERINSIIPIINDTIAGNSTVDQILLNSTRQATAGVTTAVPETVTIEHATESSYIPVTISNNVTDFPAASKNSIGPDLNSTYEVRRQNETLISYPSEVEVLDSTIPGIISTTTVPELATEMNSLVGNNDQNQIMKSSIGESHWKSDQNSSINLIHVFNGPERNVSDIFETNSLLVKKVQSASNVVDSTSRPITLPNLMHKLNSPEGNTIIGTLETNGSIDGQINATSRTTFNPATSAAADLIIRSDRLTTQNDLLGINSNFMGSIPIEKDFVMETTTSKIALKQDFNGTDKKAMYGEIFSADSLILQTAKITSDPILVSTLTPEIMMELNETIKNTKKSELLETTSSFMEPYNKVAVSVGSNSELTTVFANTQSLNTVTNKTKWDIGIKVKNNNTNIHGIHYITISNNTVIVGEAVELVATEEFKMTESLVPIPDGKTKDYTIETTTPVGTTNYMLNNNSNPTVINPDSPSILTKPATESVIFAFPADENHTTVGVNGMPNEPHDQNQMNLSTSNFVSNTAGTTTDTTRPDTSIVFISHGNSVPIIKPGNQNISYDNISTIDQAPGSQDNVLAVGESTEGSTINSETVIVQVTNMTENEQADLPHLTVIVDVNVSWTENPFVTPTQLDPQNITFISIAHGNQDQKLLNNKNDSINLEQRLTVETTMDLISPALARTTTFNTPNSFSEHTLVTQQIQQEQQLGKSSNPTVTPKTILTDVTVNDSKFTAASTKPLLPVPSTKKELILSKNTLRNPLEKVLINNVFTTVQILQNTLNMSTTENTSFASIENDHGGKFDTKLAIHDVANNQLQANNAGIEVLITTEASTGYPSENNYNLLQSDFGETNSNSTQAKTIVISSKMESEDIISKLDLNKSSSANGVETESNGNIAKVYTATEVSTGQFVIINSSITTPASTSGAVDHMEEVTITVPITIYLDDIATGPNNKVLHTQPKSILDISEPVIMKLNDSNQVSFPESGPSSASNNLSESVDSTKGLLQKPTPVSIKKKEVSHGYNSTTLHPRSTAQGVDEQNNMFNLEKNTMSVPVTTSMGLELAAHTHTDTDLTNTAINTPTVVKIQEEAHIQVNKQSSQKEIEIPVTINKVGHSAPSYSKKIENGTSQVESITENVQSINDVNTKIISDSNVLMTTVSFSTPTLGTEPKTLDITQNVPAINSYDTNGYYAGAELSPNSSPSKEIVTEKNIVANDFATKTAPSTRVDLVAYSKQNLPAQVANPDNHSISSTQLSVESPNKKKEVITSTYSPVATGVNDVTSQIEVTTSSATEPSVVTANLTKPTTKALVLTISATPASTRKVITNTSTNSNQDVVPAKTTLYCLNRKHGRYADNNDCRKFYICSGITHPIIGLCPTNTVFSEIKRQCTKNLSHCIRENQFKCTSQGRFSDFLNQNVYYICITNGRHAFVRFKFQCQQGYILNKASVRCEQKESEDSASKSTVEKKSQEVKDKSDSDKKSRSSSKVKEDFECEEEGKFRDPNNCRRYYVCSRRNRSEEYRRRRKKCDSDEVFHKDEKKCVDAESYECS